MYELIVQKEYAWNLKSVYIRWMKRLRTHYYRNKHFSQLFQVLFYFKILSSLYMWMYSKCIQHIVLCSAAIRSVAMMAALWKKPVVTWTPIKEDSDSFPTLIATLGSYEDIARNIATLLQCQGWKTIGKYIHVTVPTMSTWDKQTLLTTQSQKHRISLYIQQS